MRTGANLFSRKVKRILIGTMSVLLISAVPAGAHSAEVAPAVTSDDNVVLQWSSAMLDSAAQSPAGAPILARAYGIVHTCMYDAWAAYDGIAVGTQLGGTLRRPAEERTPENKAEAISYAAHRAAVTLFPHGEHGFDALLLGLGFDPRVPVDDQTSPAAIGTRACDAVLKYRRQDYANQDGGRGGDPYSDWTGYVPANLPMNLDQPFDPTTVRDPNRWQPLSFHNGTKQVTQQYLGPHWGMVTPFAPPSEVEGPPPGGIPEMYPSPGYVRQARDLVELSANLTDRQKVIAEYWRLNPGTAQPPGKWLELARFVSRRDSHTLDEDVKMFFILGNAIMDAGITSWSYKRQYDYVRPITAIRWLFRDEMIRTWAGPGQGTREIPGSEWLPYQSRNALSPPFAEHTSGHSTFSSAAAEILKRFTGSDAFGASVLIRAGESDTEPGLVPSQDLRLTWTTFSEAADQAGMSRRYGGIHFENADLGGRRTGRLVADACWQKAMAYINGMH